MIYHEVETYCDQCDQISNNEYCENCYSLDVAYVCVECGEELDSYFDVECEKLISEYSADVIITAFKTYMFRKRCYAAFQKNAFMANNTFPNDITKHIGAFIQ